MKENKKNDIQLFMKQIFVIQLINMKIYISSDFKI